MDARLALKTNSCCWWRSVGYGERMLDNIQIFM